MLQLEVPKIYDGSSRCALHANSRGSGGIPLRKSLKIRCQEIEFGGIFGGFSC